VINSQSHPGQELSEAFETTWSGAHPFSLQA
jgi:hypothetical protein